MKIVVLTSGGLDSSVVAKLARESGAEVFPLFVDYRQRAGAAELRACERAMKSLGISAPVVADMTGFGRLILSGLTDSSQRVYEDAFTPGRNLLFLLVGAAYARQIGAEAVAIGLLNEDTSLFPDQRASFLEAAESALRIAVDAPIKVLAPLAEFHKKDVVQLAIEKGIKGTYSCHAGGVTPCGLCIACREYLFED